MTGFSGFTFDYTTNTPRKQRVGFSGFTIFISGLTPVMVQDVYGRGITGVMLTAANPTSGIPFITETDANGNALMQLDAATEVKAEFNSLVETVNYVTSAQLVITLQSKIFEAV